MTSDQETQLLGDMAIVKQAIMGNGVKGLAQRMNEMEEWRHTHPRVCPMNEPPNPRKANRLGIFFAIIGAMGVVGSLIVAVLK